MGESIKMNLRERYFENDSKYNQMLAKLNRISMGFFDSEDITSDFFEGMSDTAVDLTPIYCNISHFSDLC